MDTWVWIVIVAAVAAVIVIAVAWYAARQKRHKELRESFGPEYDRTVRETGSRGRAEAELEDRRERVEKLRIRPLSEEQRRHFSDDWGAAQARFVDEPGAAIAEADRLVQEAMRSRGYPVTDFEQRAADLSVDYPELVSNYRSAHAIATLNGRGEATTEQLRQAMVHYRSLFNEILSRDSEQARRSA
jgi:hypothetical protein